MKKINNNSMGDKIIPFDEYLKLHEDFYNPFDKDDDTEKEKKPSKIKDNGGLLSVRKESYNPSRIEWSKRPGGEYTVKSKTHFARGEIIEICPVKILDEIAKTINGLKDIIFEINKKENLWGLVLGYGSLYKHSEEPTCDFAYNKSTRQMYFIARRPIKVGEELTINYGKEYWQERMDFNMMGDEERTDQNQGMPRVSKETSESEVQPNAADIQNTQSIKGLSSPKNPHNPVRTGIAIKGMGQQ
ncbi:MAG: SET domain-containing protein-lysine N-methyltransferase [Nanoarchaeota archaeon]